MRQSQRKKSKLFLNHYLEQRAQLAALDITRSKIVDNTKKASTWLSREMSRLLSKSVIVFIYDMIFRFCDELDYSSKIFLKNAQISDFKIFWKWTMNRYNRINVISSLRVFWRILRMYAFVIVDRDFDFSEKRDIRNVRYWYLRVSKFSH